MTARNTLCSLWLSIACIGIFELGPLAAQAQPQLYGIDNTDGYLDQVDAANGSWLGSVAISLPGETISGSNGSGCCTGLAVNPQTNVMYAAVKLASQSGPGRNLITIDPATGAATNIGHMSQPIASLAFTSAGTLYGVTGDCAGGGCGGSVTPESLYTINLTNASLTFVQTLGNGDDGEAIAFNPLDGMMYHMSGVGLNLIFEKINLSTKAVTNIPLSGDTIDTAEATGFTFDANRGLFVGGVIDWNLGEGYFGTITPAGVITQVGYMDYPWKDYAFWLPSVDSDGDGVPDNADDCPYDPTETVDTDGDGICNNTDTDDDGDGIPDNLDAYPLGRFADVDPASYWAFLYIETLARSGITGGCGGDNYCPENPVTRAQMAVFLERGMKGSGYNPPPATGTVFFDVASNAFAANFIEQFFADGITAGCGSGNYCPNAPVTRGQMAVFLLRAKHGAGYAPPPATGDFSDVSLSNSFAPWIEQLAAEGITSGCGNGKYCPGESVTRAQMAVFLVRTFSLL